MTLEARGGMAEAYIRQGRAEGINLGRAEGIAQQRGLLRRQAAARFGAATAARLARALAAETDPEPLAAVGEAIVRCATADELLRETGGCRSLAGLRHRRHQVRATFRSRDHKFAAATR